MEVLKNKVNGFKVIVIFTRKFFLGLSTGYKAMKFCL